MGRERGSGRRGIVERREMEEVEKMEEVVGGRCARHILIYFTNAHRQKMFIARAAVNCTTGTNVTVAELAKVKLDCIYLQVLV